VIDVELSGVRLAQAITDRARLSARSLAATGRAPTLVVVVATDDESSAWYVRSLARSAAKAEVTCEIRHLGPAATTSGIQRAVRDLSADPDVHGIIVQTPLPPGVSMVDVAPWISVDKDVDGANPASLGRLMAGYPGFAPATAEAVVALLDHHAIDVAGRHAVVVGRSTVVGKPVGQLLLDRDATVTVCHSRTPDLVEHTRQADVLVVAVGRARMIRAGHVRPGAVVVDVGTNAVEGGLVGDVDSAGVAAVAAALSPVPGGVGPVTSMLLIEHTVRAAHDAAQRVIPD
jgi:methylenetetrahydrofolate dehydrogenase (NADP+)/methenyltetrahydrofolate cyclohydrolase